MQGTELSIKTNTKSFIEQWKGEIQENMRK